MAITANTFRSPTKPGIHSNRAGNSEEMDGASRAGNPQHCSVMCLRDHLMRGWTINEKRLLARGVEFDQAVALLTTTLRNQPLVAPDNQAPSTSRGWQRLLVGDAR